MQTSILDRLRQSSTRNSTYSRIICLLLTPVTYMKILKIQLALQWLVDTAVTRK